jgi:ADP-heptose:LPS heptosyltransferase/predicted SAM-dependent methyltransferase
MTWANDPKQNRAFEFGESGKIRWEVVEYTRGSGLELGCGPVKLFPHFIGIDKEVFDPAHGPSLVMDCSKFPCFADGAFAFVFSSHLLEHIEDTRGALAEWWRLIEVGGYLVLYLPHKDLYPNIGEPGANADHKHDFVPEDILEAMRDVAESWDCVRNEVRSAGDEYSFFQVFKKLEPGHSQRESWQEPKPAKTAAVFRPGRYGDAIFASSVLWHLKREGYHVTLHTEEHCEPVLRHDPNIDRMVVLGHGQVPEGFLTQYFEGVRGKYDRSINLVESLEKNMLAWPTDGRFLWPAAMRRKVFGENYLEFIHDIAGVPHEFHQKFYTTKAERGAIAWRAEHCGDAPMVVIAASGSTLPKFWPHLPFLVEQLADAGVHVVVLGDLREMKLAKRERVTVIGTQWPIREAMVLTQVADVVVGQETGLLNAVAMEPMRKVVLLSHSTHENLVKHWVNAKSLTGDVPCYPCHQIHLTFDKCTVDKATGCAACQAAIDPHTVLAEVMGEVYRLQQAAVV